MEDQRKAALHSRQAVWDLGEVAAPQVLLAFEMEGTVVGRDQLQVVLEQALPELVVMPRRSQRRRAHVFRSLEARPAEVVQAEIKILRASLGKGRGAVIARLPNRIERLFRTQVHDVDGDLRKPGQT